MSLAEDLTRLASLPGAMEPQRAARPTAPSGWEPGVKYEPGGAMVVTAMPSEPLETEDEWRDAVEALGLRVPNGYRVRLVEARFDPYAWTREKDGEDAVTRPAWRYRFAVEPELRTVKVDELLASIKTPKPRPSAIEAPVYVVALADTQIGKPDGDGTAGTVRRVLDAHARALKRFTDLRKRGKAGEVVIVVAGDCIEGTESQGSRLLARLDCDVTTQVRIYRRLLAQIVTDYADKADRVRVAVVPGNHDEAKRVGDKMATHYTDSWALEGAASVADALDIAGYGDRVAWIMPSFDELTVTLDVAGTTLGVLHGHQTRGKMDTWLAAQAQGRYAIGTADVIISGHYHHLRVQQLGPTTWVQTPSLDGASLWWRHSGHTDAPPGMVTMLMGGGSWQSLEIV
jgi:predicted phosphodiesterase